MTHSYLSVLTEVTLVFEDANSKLDNTLVEILRLRFSKDYEREFLFLVIILKLKFGQDFEVYSW